MNEELRIDKPLPVGDVDKKSTGWWGIWILIATEGSLFGYLLLTYFYLYFQNNQPWPPEGHPKLLIPGINTAILLTSSVFVWATEHCVKQNRPRLSLLPLVIGIVLGIIFIGIQLHEWSNKNYNIATHQYGSLYFTITGFHMAHVVVGLIILSLMLLWTALGYFDEKRHLPLTIGGLYWHFVDAVWLFIFSSLYLFPYIPIPWR